MTYDPIDTGPNDSTADRNLGTSGDPIPETFTDDLDTKRSSDDYHYAGAYDGADADARLDAAISAATDGDVIHLESATYSDARTIGKRFRITGGAGMSPFHADVTGTWTLNGFGTTLENLQLSADPTFGAILCTILNCRVPTNISTSKDQIGFLGGEYNLNTITFDAGTSGGIVDSVRNVNVTDNGTNTVGDTS